jgi:hypothetical protein
VEQSITRRTILSLAGAGLTGAGAILSLATPAAAERNDGVKLASERSYRALALPGQGWARIASTDAGTGSPARVEATLDRHSMFENQELVIQVHALVPTDMVGRRRVLRSMMIGDTGDLRVETVGPEIRIDHPEFALEIALGRGDPIRDWNLIRERIFAVRVTLDILDSDDFAVSDDFRFKVRRA